MKNRVG